MPKRNDLTISKRTVDGLSAAEDTVFWDHELPGYGVRVYPTGRKVYVVQSRGPGGPKRVTLGRHGDISAEQARGKAAGVIDRIKRGEDPVPPPPAPGLTVAGLAERYMEGHVAVNCNAHTAGIYRGSLGNHILPALGELAIEAVGREHAAALHYGLRDTPRAANRALMVLTKMFSLAEAWGLAPEGSNPCRFVVKYREHPRERFLTPEEYRRLGRVMDAAQWRGGIWRQAVAALRLLMLTGCRLQRDPDPALGRCGPDGGRAASQGRQDGRADGHADAHGGEGARVDCPGSGQSLGDRRARAGRPYNQPLGVLVPRAGAGGARGRAHSRPEA